ncbi:hypothetical protein [Hydrogenophaga sp. 5NK40-0174]|uniref:hypothetical protein n=1 Tax=Hydrogenophaga sp. 5NK40-0174 TaxID=3127649 RepID=UPI003342AD80
MLSPFRSWRLAAFSLVLGLSLLTSDDSLAAEVPMLDQVSGLPEPVKLQLTKLSSTIIPVESRSCEEDAGPTVASVMKSMESFDAVPWSYGCTGAECWLVASSCKPGQKAECGQRFLRFRVEASGHVDPGSFQCVDVP